MELAIIGFPQSGKSAVFQALTGGKGESGSKRTRGTLGVVKVPDPRLDTLAAMFKPKRVVPTEITYLDIPGALAGLGKGKGIEGQFLEELSRVDALIHVVRAFGDGTGTPPEAERLTQEIAAMEMELAFSDLGIIERRLHRLEATLKSPKSQEREAAQREMRLLARLKAGLEAEILVRNQGLTPEERHYLQDFQLLTAKPLLVVLNIAEGQIREARRLEEAVQRPGRPPVPTIAVCGKLEAELAQLDEADAKAFMEDAGLQESSLRRMARLSYQALGVATFFTFVSQEVHAWTVRQGATAPQAAGKVHTDMERGFIRAEVVHFQDLVAAGSLAEARKRGVLRTEGKGYVVRDGDVITFLFNV